MEQQRKTFKQRIEVAQRGLRFAVTDAILAFTEQVVKTMRDIGTSKADLARELKASPAYVTKMLRGKNNFTLESMVKVSRALNSELIVHLRRESNGSEWFPSGESVIVVDSLCGAEAFSPQQSLERCKRGSLFSPYNRKVSHEVFSTSDR